SGRVKANANPTEFLEMTDSYIKSSYGAKIDFERDSKGRIVAAVDQDGNKVLYGYDSNGDLVSFTDKLGNVTKFEYNSTRKHYLDKVIDPLNRSVIKNEYDALGRLSKVFDANGNPISISYDPINQIQSVTNALGYSTTHEYDDRGNTIQTLDALGGIERFEYDSKNNVTKSVNLLGGVTSYVYNYDGSGGYTVTETDPLGFTVTRKIDSQGREISSIDAFGNVQTSTFSNNFAKYVDVRGNVYELNGTSGSAKLNGVEGYRTSLVNGQLATVTDANGVATNYTYDSAGRPTEAKQTVTDIYGNKTEVITKTEYDLNGNATKLISPDGRFTQITYNAAGLATRVENQNGQYEAYEYDGANKLTSRRYTDGTVETYIYDAAGNLTSIITNGNTASKITIVRDALGREKEVVFADGTKNTATYDAAGNPLEIHYSDGSFEKYTYDVNSNVLSYEDQNGKKLKYTYRVDGSVDMFTDPNGGVYKYYYNSLGDLTELVLPDGTIQKSASSESKSLTLGTPVKVSDSNGNGYSFEIDKTNQITGIVDSNGNRHSYKYDELGRIISETSFASRTTNYEYDIRNRRTARVLSNGQKEEFTYNSNDQVTSYKDTSGNSINYEYDGNGNLIKSSLPDTSTVVYAYYDNGLVKSITNNSGTQSYEYDSDGNLTKFTDLNGNVINYSYDLVDRKFSVSSISGTTTYSFNTDGNLIGVNDAKTGNVTYTYDTNGLLKTKSLPNGVVETYGWDNRGLLATLVQVKGNETIASYIYSRDNFGNISRIDENVGLNSERHIEYQYDNLNRLSLEKISQNGDIRTISYRYDGEGNLLNRNDSQDGLTVYTYGTSGVTNGLLLSKDVNGVISSYSYDSNGNRIKEVSSLGIKEYNWDALKRLSGLKVEDSSGNVLHSYIYTYDAQGNRISETVDGVTTQFVLDYNLPYAQVREAIQGQQVSAYYVSDGSASPLAQANSSNTTFYLGDRQDSTRVKVDGSGAITDRYSYDAYGRIISGNVSTTEDYLFAGESYNPTTGLQYLRFRYRDVDTNSFISRDVVEGDLYDPLSRNQYLYAKANPVTYTDPTGLYSLAEFAATRQIQDILNNLKTANYINKLEELTTKIEGFVTALWIAGVGIELLSDYLQNWPFGGGGAVGNLLGGASGQKSGLPIGSVLQGFKPPKTPKQTIKKIEYGWGPGLSVIKDKDSIAAVGLSPAFSGFYGVERNDEKKADPTNNPTNAGSISGNKFKITIGAALKINALEIEKSSLDFKVGLAYSRELVLYEKKYGGTQGTATLEITAAKITFGVETKYGTSASTSTKLSVGAEWNIFFGLTLGEVFATYTGGPGSSFSSGAAFKYKINVFQIGLKALSKNDKKKGFSSTGGVYLKFLGGGGDVIGNTNL
ncbi:MAG: RHS repeat-associated core domain-containing protein, partial [Pseudanabaena sp.]